MGMGVVSAYVEVHVYRSYRNVRKIWGGIFDSNYNSIYLGPNILLGPSIYVSMDLKIVIFWLKINIDVGAKCD